MGPVATSKVCFAESRDRRACVRIRRGAGYRRTHSSHCGGNEHGTDYLGRIEDVMKIKFECEIAGSGFLPSLNNITMYSFLRQCPLKSK